MVKMMYMRKLLLLSALALLGAGCASEPVPRVVPPTPPPAGSSVEVPAAQPGHPPVVVMTQGEVVYPGVEGSYCYSGTCADKISPTDLITSAALAYKDVNDGESVYFSVGEEDVVFEFAANMQNASGTDLGLKIPVSFRNGQYFVKVPNVPGKNIVLAFVRFGTTETGGDVTYAFPVNVR